MRNLVYFIVLVFFPVCTYAQTGKDSIYILDHEQIIYSKNFQNHNLSSPLDLGVVTLNYFGNEGSRRLAQQAYRNQEVNFYAVGANQLGDFRLSGDFLFNKVFEDSLSYGQRNNLDEWSPFNYYATKAGKYERQNYKSNVTLSYKFNNAIQPFFNINYLSHWTTGSVDPRFESKKFEMKYNPGIILHHKVSNIGLKAIFGKGRENMGISFKNTNYSQSLIYPDRIHYLNLGYGLNSIKDTLNTRKYSKIIGGEVSLHTKFGRSIIDIDASLERKDDDNTNDLKSTNVYRKRGEYQQDTYKVNSSLQLMRNNEHHLFLLNANYISGKDGLINFSPTFDKVNYSINYLQTKGAYLYTRTSPKKWNYDLGLDVDYFSINRKDYASFLSVKNVFIHATPKLNLRSQISNSDYLQLGFQPKFILDIDNSIHYSPNSLNNYIQGVVFWDYDYYRTNAMNLNWNFKWMTSKISSDYLVGIKANYNFEKSFNNPNDTYLSKFTQSSNRRQYSISLFINL